VSDVLITFEDGSTELRPANSPCVLADEPVTWTPVNVIDIDDLPTDDSDPGLWVVTDKGGPLRFSRNRRGARTSQLRAWRGFSTVLVWRIVACELLTGALCGEWQSATVETVDEQIARLTRERDAAVRAIGEAAKTMERAVGLLNDQRPVLRRFERNTPGEIDSFEAGVAEQTIDTVIEELQAAIAIAKETDRG